MISQMRNELCVTRLDRPKTCLSTSASRLVLATFLAAGTLVAALPASAAVVNVANEGQLRNAIANAHNGDVINVTANITLSANLPLVKSNVTINGGNFTLSGNNLYRGLYVKSGTVAINDLKIVNANAQGGNGGKGGGGGGGGAGLGGALYVANGANVTVSNVSLQNNLARGGNGGSRSLDLASGGGGGMFGNGEYGGKVLNGERRRWRWR